MGDVAALAHRLPQCRLRTLRLASCQLMHAHAETLARAFKGSTLTELDLADNALDAEGLRVLTETFEGWPKSLTLNLARNAIQSPDSASDMPSPAVVGLSRLLC